MRITVRLAPHARTERIDGIARLADGRAAVKVSVTAPAEGGRANDALLRLLAREWRLPRRDLTIVAGARSRNKTVEIAGDPAALLARLAAGLVPGDGFR